MIEGAEIEEMMIEEMIEIEETNTINGEIN
jgi:hypothetical protein